MIKRKQIHIQYQQIQSLIKEKELLSNTIFEGYIFYKAFHSLGN